MQDGPVSSPPCSVQQVHQFDPPVERLKQLLLEYLHDSIRSAKERALLTLPTHSISDCKTAKTSSFPAVFFRSPGRELHFEKTHGSG